MKSSRIHSSDLTPSTLRPSQLAGQSSLVLTGGDKKGRYQLGWPGLNPKQPSLDLFMFDHSGSVSATGGVDPIGNRFKEAWHAIEAVAKWSNGKAKVGLLSFDQPSAGNLAPGTLANRVHLARIKKHLRIPAFGAGSSELGLALTCAEAITGTYFGHEIRLTILSDFELLDDDPAEIFTRLAAFPGTVHAVVLGQKPPLDLIGTNIVITEIHHGDKPGSLATAVHTSLTASRPGRRQGSVRINTRSSIPPLSPGSAPHQSTTPTPPTSA